MDVRQMWVVELDHRDGLVSQMLSNLPITRRSNTFTHMTVVVGTATVGSDFVGSVLSFGKVLHRLEEVSRRNVRVLPGTPT